MGFIDGIKSTFKNLKNTALEAGESFKDGVEGVGKTALGTITNNSSLQAEGVDKIKESANHVKNAGESALDAGKDVAKLTRDGVASVASNIPITGPALAAGVYAATGDSQKASKEINKYKTGEFIDDIPVVGGIKMAAEGNYAGAAVNFGSSALCLIPGAGPALGASMKVVGTTAAKTVVKEGAEKIAETAIKETAEKTITSTVKSAAKDLSKETVTEIGTQSAFEAVQSSHKPKTLDTSNYKDLPSNSVPNSPMSDIVNENKKLLHNFAY